MTAALHTEAMAQQVDILPTLCTLLDLPTPDPADGLPLPFELQAGQRLRSFVFFDSSAGGNLTPLDRRSERLQGAADGSCLLTRRQTTSGTVTTVIPLAAAECRETDEQALQDQLMAWQEHQTGQRLGILSRSDGEQAPDLALADSSANESPSSGPRPIRRKVRGTPQAKSCSSGRAAAPSIGSSTPSAKV